MSPINGIQGAPNLNPAEVGQVQGQPQAVRANNAGQPQRINDIVDQAEVLPHQPRRAERTTAQQVGYVLARVAGAVLSLGTSELVIHWMRVAEQQNADALRQQALDRRPTAAQTNQSLAEAVKNGAGLPVDHHAAVREAVAYLRETFGDIVPENVADLNGLPRAFDIKSAVSAAISEAQEEVTSEALLDVIKEKAAPFLARKAGELALGQAFQNLNFEANAAVRYTSLVATYPDLKAELEACRDRRSVDNVLGAWKERIEGYAAHFKTMTDGKKAALEHAIQRFADKFGVSVEAIGRALNTQKLTSSFSYLKFEIGTPEADIRQAYMDKAESFLEKKFALLDSVDQLPVTQELKAFWKNEALTDASLSSADTFTKAEAVASRVPENKIVGIEELLADGTQDADTVYAALQSLSVALHEAQIEVHGGFDKWKELGGDGQGTARFHAAKVLLTRMPALQAALENSTGLIDKLHERTGDERYSDDPYISASAVQTDFLITALQTKSVDNAQLATSLGDLAQMPVPFLAALNHAEAAVRANFADMGLPADILSFQPGVGSKVGDALKDAVAKADAPLTPAQFSELAQKLMNTAVANSVLLSRVRELAAEGEPLKQFQDVWVARTLVKRHPELSEAFASGDAATVRAALGALDGEVAALVHLRQDLNAAWAAGEAHLFNRMAEITGMDQQELRATLNLAGVTFGGSFAYKQADILEAMEKPGAAIPSREELMASYEAIAQKFVGRKSALYQSIDSFGLPAEAAAELKKKVLTDSTLKMPDFLTRCSDAAKFIAAAPLRDMLSDGRVTKESLLEMLGQMAGHYEAASHVFFPQDILNDMGSDETGAIQRYTLQIFFARNPDLKGALPREIAADVDDAAAAEATRMVSLAGDSYNLPPEERTAFMQQYANAIVTYAFVNNMKPQD